MHQHEDEMSHIEEIISVVQSATKMNKLKEDLEIAEHKFNIICEICGYYFKKKII